MKWFGILLVLVALGLGVFAWQKPEAFKGLFAMHHSTHEGVHANHGKHSALTKVVAKNANSDIGQGDWRLETTEGKPFTPASLRTYRQPSLVFFGFTHCPDICPTTLNTFAAVKSGLSPMDKARLKMFFVTIDPERDTLEQLANYTESFSKNIVGVRGDKEALKPLLDAFKAYGHAHHNNDASGGADHSSLVYLMNDKGKLVQHFGFNVPTAELLNAVRDAL